MAGRAVPQKERQERVAKINALKNEGVAIGQACSQIHTSVGDYYAWRKDASATRARHKPSALSAPFPAPSSGLTRNALASELLKILARLQDPKTVKETHKALPGELMGLTQRLLSEPAH